MAISTIYDVSMMVGWFCYIPLTLFNSRLPARAPTIRRYSTFTLLIPFIKRHLKIRALISAESGSSRYIIKNIFRRKL